jgi:hypothetical protein
MMFDAAFTEVGSGSINGVPDAVFFVVVNADEGGGFGADGG